jgi:hypothetical protein
MIHLLLLVILLHLLLASHRLLDLPLRKAIHHHQEFPHLLFLLLHQKAIHHRHLFLLRHQIAIHHHQAILLHLH